MAIILPSDNSSIIESLLLYLNSRLFYKIYQIYSVTNAIVMAYDKKSLFLLGQSTNVFSLLDIKFSKNKIGKKIYPSLVR